MLIKPIEEPIEWLWVQDRTHLIRMEDSVGLIAYLNGKRVAACVADSFGKDSCSVHITIENPLVLRRGFLEEVADGLFNQRGMKRVFGLVPSNNAKALKLNKHLGWQEIARIPNGHSEGVDYIIMEMTPKTCRWLNKRQEAA